MINQVTKRRKQGSGRQLPILKFERISEGSFQQAVQERVEAYFASQKLSRNANAEMIIKTILILVGWIGTYTLIITNSVGPWTMLILAACHGFFAAMIGINIGHDAIHGAFSKNPKTNRRFGLLFNLVGANDYVWNISHNIVHHTYTNIPHHDEDIHQIPILRMEPTQELRPIHRFQHIYAYLLYGLASLSWVFVKDYVKFFQHQLGSHYRKTFPRKEIIRLFAYKAFYYSVFLVIPLLTVNLAWYWIVMGFVVAHLVEGYVLAIMFMLGHIIEGVEYPEPDEDGKIAMPWADLQMHTTANFATGSRIANVLCGGLNFQTEHHLFPKICHVHYPRITKIVRQTAKDFNLPYIEYETFTGALASHTRMLRKFGTAPAE